MPGTAEQKRPLIECMSCHTLERVVRSKFTADEFVGVLKRMANYANNSTTRASAAAVVERRVSRDRARKVAEYLATRQSEQDRDTGIIELKALPRPTGRATHVIITEYDMPRKTIAPHDVRTDAQRLHLVLELRRALSRPARSAHRRPRRNTAIRCRSRTFPAGALALEPDHDGNWWLALMFQGGLMKFDVRTKTFRHYPLPPEIDSDTAQQSMVMPGQSQVDGKVWTNDVNSHSILRLDLATGNYEIVDPFKDMPVGPPAFALRHGGGQGQQSLSSWTSATRASDASTPRRSAPPSTRPRPRARGRAAPCSTTTGHLWFAEFAANKLGMFDIDTRKLQGMGRADPAHLSL